MVDTRNIWMHNARLEIAEVLQKAMDERYKDQEPDKENMGDYYAGYCNAILDIARRFKFGFYGQPDGSYKIKDQTVLRKE
jgi:hypothetical protein